jgi:GT2 family glycosyltransferase
MITERKPYQQPDNNRLTIVIPVHNRLEYTRDCLRSLRLQSVPVAYIIVVDDGSTDGTAEMIATEFPEVIVLKGNGKLYWTAAVNMGVRLALDLNAGFIMTMNNDTIAPFNFIERMLAGAVQKPGALIGALDVDAVTGKVYYGGEIIHWANDSSKYLLDELDEKDRKGLHEVSLFPARGLLIPRRVFEDIGLFEDYYLPHYMADYDFTLMARRHGYKVFCNYDATIMTFPEEGGDHKIRKSKTLKSYYNHLFSIKGGGNLRNFTIYAIRNCPKYLLPFSLISGYTRRLVGFWIK